MYRLDKTSFKKQSFKEANNQVEYWRKKTINERFKAAWYLICVAYNLDITKEHKLDRKKFSMRKHE